MVSSRDAAFQYSQLKAYFYNPPLRSTPPFLTAALCMGKRLLSPASLEKYAQVAAERTQKSKIAKPSLKSLASNEEEVAAAAAASRDHGRGMDDQEQQADRVPLKEVVADCTRRWFQDALKEARAGDTGMQILVAQMYRSGYGVPKNEQKANAWFAKASKYRSSIWKVRDKRPGYNASDSDSDEENNIKT